MRPRTSRPAAVVRAAAWLIFFAGLALPANAPAEDRPFKLILNTTESWDSNVFRLPEGAPDPQLAQGNTGKADRFNALTYGLRFDKSYAQQHFVVELRKTDTRYDKFSSLNRQAHNDHAQWDWRLGSRISGILSADHVDSEVALEDITLGRRLITTTTDSLRFTVDGWLFGGWHLLGGASQSESVNGQVFTSIPGAKQTNREFGLRYVATSGSSISAMQRWSDGVYPGQNVSFGNLIENRFTVRETELSGAWIVSMRSTLNGRMTWLERRYQGPVGLDFSGMTGELSYSWTPTGRLSVNASARRNLTPFFDLTSNHLTTDTFSIGPAWTISDKVTLSMSASRSVSDYAGSSGVAAGPPRHDTTDSARITASWIAHRKLTLGASVVLDRRRSNFAGVDYSGALTSLTASLTF